MEEQINIIIIIISILTTLFSLLIIVKNIMIVKLNKIIRGVIHDRRNSGNDHYFPVIQYEIDNQVEEYLSSHYSVLQKIGHNIRLVYNSKRKNIIGTFGELFFKPVTLFITGLFITFIMLLYFSL